MKYANYLIQQGDTLELVAGRYLHDPSRWMELARINNLRFPFISDDIGEQLGQALFHTTLSAAFAGGFVLRLGASSPAITAGKWVLLRGTGGAVGRDFFDTAIVRGYGSFEGGKQVWSEELTAFLPAGYLAALGTGSMVYLSGEPQHTYAVGTRVGFYPDPATIRTRVLGTGATLRLPLSADTSNILSTDDAAFRSLLGTDFALSGDGFLSLDGGDIATAEGVQNLSQALRVRVLTETGELLMHPEYGDDLPTYVGSTLEKLPALAYAAVSQCFLSDPRVQRIVALRIVREGDSLSINVALGLKDRTALLSLSDIIIPVQA